MEYVVGFMLCLVVLMCYGYIVDSLSNKTDDKNQKRK